MILVFFFQQNNEKRRADGILQRRSLSYDCYSTVVWYRTDGLLPRSSRNSVRSEEGQISGQCFLFCDS